LLLAATVRSFAHMPLGMFDRNSICISWSWQSASYCYFESFPDKVT